MTRERVGYGVDYGREVRAGQTRDTAANRLGLKTVGRPSGPGVRTLICNLLFNKYLISLFCKLWNKYNSILYGTEKRNEKTLITNDDILNTHGNNQSSETIPKVLIYIML